MAAMVMVVATSAMVVAMEATEVTAEATMARERLMLSLRPLLTLSQAT